MYTMWVVWFMQDRWVHWSAPWVSSGSSGVAGVIGVRPGGGGVHPGPLG